MGDAPGMRLTDLQAEIRKRMGTKCVGMSGGADEVVCTALRFWPERAMAIYAAKQKTSGSQVLDAISVIWAKVREDLEARWGMDSNTQSALDVLVQPIVVELANVWFSSADARIAMRACIVEAIRSKTQ